MASRSPAWTPQTIRTVPADQATDQATSPKPACRGGRIEHPLRNALRAATARLGLRFASKLSSTTMRRLGSWAADLAITVPGRARNAILVNLSLCFPDLDERSR